MIEKEQVLWQVAQQMTLNLQANTKKLADRPVAELENIAQTPGIFAVFYNGRELGLGIGKTDELAMLYVDAASQIVRHLGQPDTGATGLRRSLAAMLAYKYDLQAKPRTTDEEDVDRFDNYALKEESEAKLTDWMKDNLYISVVDGLSKSSALIGLMIDFEILCAIINDTAIATTKTISMVQRLSVAVNS